MLLLQAILYITAVVILVLAAFRVPTRISLALLGAAALALGYTLPVMTAAF
jgi:hypothetical protein